MAEPFFAFMADIYQKPVYVSGEYRIDLLRRRLCIGDMPLAVTAKAFEVLAVLVERAGDVVTKDELMGTVWADTVVEENNLTQQISALRKLFSEKAGEHRYIVTVPGRGYCFVAPVSELQPEPHREMLLAGSATSSITIDISNTSGERPARTLSFDPATFVGAGLALAYVLVVCLAVFLSAHRRADIAGVRPQSVSILTFRTLGTNDDQLGVGFRDTLRAKLGTLDDIKVRPGPPDIAGADALDLGRRMNVDVVLAGSIQREGGRIRVAVEMVDIRSERIIWGKTFDESAARIFELQDSIAADVLQTLRTSKLSGKLRLPKVLLRAAGNMKFPAPPSLRTGAAVTRRPVPSVLPV